MNADALKQSAVDQFSRKRLVAFTWPRIILLYLGYIFLSFDMIGLSERASLKNARTLISDIYSYKTHVARDNRSGQIQIAIEGERKGRYPEVTSPDWVEVFRYFTGGSCSFSRSTVPIAV